MQLSRVRFLTFNLVTEPTTLITSNSENALFPLSNLKEDRTTKEFRTETGTTDAQIVFDFNTTEPVTDVAIVENSSQGFNIDSTVTVEGNFVNSWGAPPFSTTFTPSTKHGFGHVSFAEQNYRFWRISFSNTTDFTALANVFVGKNVLEAPFERNIDYNWTYENRSTSKFTANRYKQRFFDEIGKQALLKCSFKNLITADYAALQDGFDEHDIFEPIWFVIDPDADFTDTKERVAGYFYLDKVPQVTNTSFQRYKLDFSLRQAL